MQQQKGTRGLGEVFLQTFAHNPTKKPVRIHFFRPRRFCHYSRVSAFRRENRLRPEFQFLLIPRDGPKRSHLSGLGDHSRFVTADISPSKDGCYFSSDWIELNNIRDGFDYGCPKFGGVSRSVPYFQDAGSAPGRGLAPGGTHRAWLVLSGKDTTWGSLSGTGRIRDDGRSGKGGRLGLENLRSVPWTGRPVGKAGR